MLRGHKEEAERIVTDIEAQVMRSSGKALPKLEGKPMRLAVRDHTPWGDVFGSMLGENRMRSVLALVLMVGRPSFSTPSSLPTASL